MKGFALILLCLIDVFPSCGRRPHRPLPPEVAAGTVEKPRRVEITVSNLGYTPGSIHGRLGESLRLIFRYEPSAGECGREVVLPKQNVHVTLSEKAPVEVPVTLPSSPGEVEFSCGMNMLHGKIVVD
jgi:plastocyanin domain-containing protein